MRHPVERPPHRNPESDRYPNVDAIVIETLTAFARNHGIDIENPWFYQTKEDLAQVAHTYIAERQSKNPTEPRAIRAQLVKYLEENANQLNNVPLDDRDLTVPTPESGQYPGLDHLDDAIANIAEKRPRAVSRLKQYYGIAPNDGEQHPYPLSGAAIARAEGKIPESVMHEVRIAELKIRSAFDEGYAQQQWERIQQERAKNEKEAARERTIEEAKKKFTTASNQGPDAFKAAVHNWVASNNWGEAASTVKEILALRGTLPDAVQAQFDSTISLYLNLEVLNELHGSTVRLADSVLNERIDTCIRDTRRYTFNQKDLTALKELDEKLGRNFLKDLLVVLKTTQSYRSFTYKGCAANNPAPLRKLVEAAENDPDKLKTIIKAIHSKAVVVPHKLLRTLASTINRSITSEDDGEKKTIALALIAAGADTTVVAELIHNV